jgi:hypothetical protein
VKWDLTTSTRGAKQPQSVRRLIGTNDRHVHLPLREAPCGLQMEGVWCRFLFLVDEGDGLFEKGLGFSPLGRYLD